MRAKEIKTTPEDVSYFFALRAAYMNIVSLDKTVDDESDSLLIDFIQDTNSTDPADAASFLVLKDQLDPSPCSLEKSSRIFGLRSDFIVDSGNLSS